MNKKLKLYNPLPNARMEMWPLGDVYNPFGAMKQWYKKHFNLNGHNGIDINVQAKWGSPIYAAHDGFIRKVFTEDNSTVRYGYGIWVTNYELGIETITWHLSEVLVAQGQKVKAGDVIGKMGNTGMIKSRWGTGIMSAAERNSKGQPGSHAHFGLREVMESIDGNHVVLNRDNGHDGHIDPFQFIEHSFTKAIIGRMLIGMGIIIANLLKK